MVKMSCCDGDSKLNSRDLDVTISAWILCVLEVMYEAKGPKRKPE